MANRNSAKAVERVIDLAFDGVVRAVPHVMDATKLVTLKVIYPAALTMFSVTTAVVAKVVAPRAKN